jgi:hypothetical protein
MSTRAQILQREYLNQQQAKKTVTRDKIVIATTIMLMKSGSLWCGRIYGAIPRPYNGPTWPEILEILKR